MVPGMARELIPLVGKAVAVGPDENGQDGTTYSYITIEREDGTARHFATVQAIYEVAGLVERDAVGTFVFLTDPDECRLCFVYRDTGARHADCEALHLYFDEGASAQNTSGT
jgi:hypothetical protein